MIDKNIDALMADLKSIQSDMKLLSFSVNDAMDDLLNLQRKVQPILEKLTERAIEKTRADIEAEKADGRLVKEVAEEHGFSGRGLGVLERSDVNRMADFLYIDLKSLRGLRATGKTTLNEIVTFASECGYEIPEKLDIEFDIEKKDDVMTVFEKWGIAKGRIMTIEEVTPPGENNPFPVYRSSYLEKGCWQPICYSPSEVKKIVVGEGL